MQKANSRRASVCLTNEDDAIKVLEYCLQKKDLLKLNCKNLRAFISPFQEDKQADAYGNRLKVLPDLMYTPQNGEYPFEFNSRQFWIVYERSKEVYLTSQARKVDFLKTVRIECEGDSAEPVKEFIKFAIAGFGESNLEDMLIYENSGGAWVKSKNKRCRSMDSVILDKEISEQVLEDLKEFVDSEDWYKRMGVPYRRSYLLYGPPGTGKSSFTQALAGYMKYAICFINVSDNMSDYTFNHLLNNAPKKSVILLEDVDAMFEGRKNKDHANRLTYSGFLNSLDGVRSQQGRVIIMTTNHKERLDPALLRPGRTDAMFELSLSSKSQMERLFMRFFGNSDLAKKFAELVPDKTFSMSQLQGFLVKYKKHPYKIIENIKELLNTEENVLIEHWLETINCTEANNCLKLENCFSLAALKNLPNDAIDKILSGKLSKEKLVRLIEALRTDNFKIECSEAAMIDYVKTALPQDELSKQLLEDISARKFRSLFHLRDEAVLRQKQKIAEEHRKKNKKQKKTPVDKPADKPASSEQDEK